ncbi:MAG: hypothetical protein FJ137_05605 [Deltaproteobacteria bacterium]|nr:hypothetical protein [Deltaproteobacteria bacterium]
MSSRRVVAALPGLARLVRVALCLVVGVPSWFAPGCSCDPELVTIRPALLVQPGEATLTGVPVAQDTDITFQVPNDRIVNLDGVRAAFAEDSDPAFTVMQGDLGRVAPGETGELVVTVRPVVPGTITALLVFDADAPAVPNHVEVPLTITAIDAGLPDIELDPATVEFDVIGRADVGRETVTVRNIGIRDLVVDAVELRGDPELRLATTLPAGTVIPPQGSAAINLLFVPDDVDAHAADLFLRSNDPDEAEVHVPVSAAAVDCPVAVATVVDADVQIEPFDTVRIDGRESYSNGLGTFIPSPPEGYLWSLLVRPVGSTAVLSSTTQDRTELEVDLAGLYQVQLTVFAADVSRPDNRPIRSCAPAIVDIDVKPSEDLHMQLVWDHPSADFDLHVMQAGGTPFTHETDCYFSNRNPVRSAETPTWSFEVEENPSLDVDDDRGYGPENANIVHPAPGSRWVVLVHYWNKQTDGDPTATATLRLFVYGRQAIELSQTFADDEQLWRAIELTWGDTPLAPPTLAQLGVVEPFERPF